MASDPAQRDVGTTVKRHALVPLAIVGAIGCGQIAIGADSADGPTLDVGADTIEVDAQQDASDGSDGADAGVDCPGAVRCGASCVRDTSTNPMHCGGSCTLCAAPANAEATCESGECGIRCDRGFVENGAGCIEDEPPRLVRPMTNARVSVRAPRLRWSATTAAAYRVSICRERTCATPMLEFDTSSESARVPDALPAGTWFWRVRAIMGGTPSVHSSATWSFRVPVNDAPVEWSWSYRPDVNGDGLDDFAIAASDSSTTNAAYVFVRTLAGYAAPIAIPGSSYLPFPSHVGDVDGDGFTDATVGTGMARSVTLYRGSDPFTASYSFALPMNLTTTAYSWTSGDFGGDGFSDVALTDDLSHSLSLLPGSAAGLGSPIPLGVSNAYSIIVLDSDADDHDDILAAVDGSLIWCAGGAAGRRLAIADDLRADRRMAPAGDLDGDGYLDVVEVGHQAWGALVAVTIRGGAMGPTRGGARDLMSEVPGVSALLGDIGDVNGDGLADVAIQATGTSGTFTVLFGAADGFSAASSRVVALPCDAYPSVTRNIGDADGDLIDDGVVECGGAAWLMSARAAVPTNISGSIAVGQFVM